MDKKYKINTDYFPPSKEEVEAHKDFDVLMAQYESNKSADKMSKKSPKSAVSFNIRYRKFIYIASSVAAATLLLWFGIYKKGSSFDYQTASKTYFNNKNFIDPPFPQFINKNQYTHTVNATTGGVYKHFTGSKVSIPANAFVDNNGNSINGKVNLVYREMHDFVDFFYSGIPMTYDSASIKYHLESAGMVEIFAEKDNKRVHLAPNKTLEVELLSYIDMKGLQIPPQFNIYKLNQDLNKWEYEDVDFISLLDQNQNSAQIENISHYYPQNEKELAAAIAQIKTDAQAKLKRLRENNPSILIQKPSKPKAVDPNTTVLNFDFQEDTNNKSLYQGTLWQLASNNTITEDKIFKNPNKATLTQVNDSEYEIQLTQSEQIQTIKVKPVLVGHALKEAMNDYQEKLNHYNKLINEQSSITNQSIEDQINIALSEKIILLKNNYSTLKQQHQKYLNVSPGKTKVINKFKATELGIWNCDKPLPPQPHQVLASFVNHNNKPIEKTTLYLIDKNLNTIKKYVTSPSTPISLDINSNNFLWTIDKKNNLLVTKAQQLKSINSNDKNIKLVLEAANFDPANEDKLRSFFASL